VILRGNAVTLYPITPEDAEITQKWRTSDRAFLLNQGATTVAAQRRWIESRPESEYNWIITLPAGESVGMLSLVDIDLMHDRAEPAHFLIGEPQLVHGPEVAAEATRLVYDLAFREIGLHRLFGPVASGNKRMLTWQKYLGFTEEGRLREHYWLGGRWHDAVIIGLMDYEYPPLRRKLTGLIGDHDEL
jgi:diamine N-acetyltransferase